MTRWRSAVIGVALALATGLDAQQPARLFGRVVDSVTGLPLIHASVTLVDAASSRVALTDADGRFSVAVTDGSPAMAISKAGYLGERITLARLRATASVGLIRVAAISGRVVDTSNAPVPNVSISAELVEDGQARRAAATAVSNDIGEYRLTGLASGRYVVVATPPVSSGQTGQRGEARITYPGTDRADTMAVVAGEERQNIDFVTYQREVAQVPSAPRAGPAALARTGRIRGRITDGDGRALAGAVVRVEVDGVTQMTPTFSGSDGRYEQLLSPGTRYTLVARRDGFITMAFGQVRPSGSSTPVEVRPNETRTDIDITLPRLGAIVGRVVDDRGEPIEGASIRVFQVRYLQGRRRLVDIGGQRVVRTDDRGVYRSAGLLPGEYIVGASVGQLVLRRTIGITVAEPTADLPGYGATYFPSTLDPQASQRVSLTAGQDLSGVDIAMARAETVSVSGTITDASGTPIKAKLIMAPSRRSSVLAASPVGAEVDASGHFVFRNVMAGEYVIQASSETGEPFSEGPYVAAIVTVSGEDVTGLVLRLSAGSRVVGRVRFDGDSRPTSYSGVDLRAVPVDWDYTPLNLDGVQSARISNAGPFFMTGLSGPRVIRLISSTQGWTLKSVLLNGRDVIDEPLVFGSPAASIEDIEVVLTDRVTRLDGFVRNSRGDGLRDARVVVFSTDRKHWTEASRFMAATESAIDGGYTIRALPPGDYFAAVTLGIDDDWRDPETLESLATGAERLQLSEGETLHLDLRSR